MEKLNTFINIFHQLWKSGDTAHLNLNTHAGQAWVGIRTPLGYPGQNQQYQQQTPKYHQYSKPSPNQRSPSYFRRKQRRQAAKAAEESTTNKEETTAEEADSAEKHHNKINFENQNTTQTTEEVGKSIDTKANPTLTTEEVEQMIETNIEQPTEQPTNITSDTSVASVTSVPSATSVTTAKTNNEETDTEESINTTKNQHQCKLCTFTCRYKKSLNTHTKKQHKKENHTNDKHKETNNTNKEDNTDYNEDTPASESNSDSDSDIDSTQLDPTRLNSTRLDNDYDDVTSAEEDNTPSAPKLSQTIQPNLTTNNPPNYKIQHFKSIMECINKYCIYHQQGRCKFGDRCNKKHTSIPLITCPICEHKNMNLGQFKFHMITNHDPTKNPWPNQRTTIDLKCNIK